MRYVLTAVFVGLFALPAQADGFYKVDDRNTFVSLLDGRELTRVGIKLRVTPDGQIQGRAFGYDVTGSWSWNSGYFCRDLYWGGDDLGQNCQEVKVQGDTLRFTSDRGVGDSADLRLK
ncbi:dihydrodipicolinate reductase [Roseovarius faecimaris]|uniref:Dihydrodipicolinate reductase n=1 Tax=Roseovarius faecimaris TaxID=2494550 RepID=A0A6I6IVY2_9RHOB|nr:dihydrodipicolinate reductase [Roseovarius faecimaris]QGX99781.1 dihydrodipicolinate reductase [Roseovarius faecimaris]